MSAALTLWHKHMTKLIAHKEEGFGVLFQPILWVVLFGTGMKSVMGTVMPGAGDLYITFMVPGIIALTAMTGAIQGGLTLLEERIRGIMKEYLVAPISRVSILMGNAMSTMTKSLLQSAIILVVGVLMGAQIVGLDPVGWLGGLLLIILYGLGFAGIGLAVASRTSSTGGYHMLIFMLTLPLLFLSNAHPLKGIQTSTTVREPKLIEKANPHAHPVFQVSILPRLPVHQRQHLSGDEVLSGLCSRMKWWLTLLSLLHARSISIFWAF